MTVTKYSFVCDVCHGKRKLWLRGNDYVECPNCETTGKVDAVQETMKARTREIFLPSQGGGYVRQTAILTPRGGWRDRHGAL